MTLRPDVTGYLENCTEPQLDLRGCNMLRMRKMPCLPVTPSHTEQHHHPLSYHAGFGSPTRCPRRRPSRVCLRGFRARSPPAPQKALNHQPASGKPDLRKAGSATSPCDPRAPHVRTRQAKRLRERRVKVSPKYARQVMSLIK